MEVCHINVWGIICDNYDWGLVDSHVACRQLGLPYTGATNHTVYATPDDTRVSWMSYVKCNGTESSLFNCSVVIPEISCYSSRYAGVSCQDSKLSIIRLEFFLCMILEQPKGLGWGISKEFSSLLHAH